jgi:hypothetical protein
VGRGRAATPARHVPIQCRAATFNLAAKPQGILSYMPAACGHRPRKGHDRARLLFAASRRLSYA